ncbi:Polyketide cyclase / dehydrase and lipid transport [Bythopirellula polymerisocia]|uniref:Polyketide cyclase / dehydrase and lipid transport n=2 Tax=Bythopirellula polymerisocia TaxID=2528003 RepID=A0A5C6D238_9BACT|nr:Polyketide cyclase / dehydrase and lipid transport [Bythopirellula polymerisocia]
MLETTEMEPLVQQSTRNSRSIFSKILLGLVVVLFLLVGLIAIQPSEFRVERTATMNAPAAAVFAEVNDFHNWEAWSPWIELDPEAKNSFDGPDAGEGAVFRWDGNDDVGAGSMTITESKPNELVRIRLAFTRPFEDSSTTEFTLKPDGDETKVTWSMYGRNNFISKAFCLIMDMDKMIGDKYEEGLASLKQIVEDKTRQ